MAWSHSALVAEVYDLHLPVGYSNGDVEFYLELVRGVDGTILEPGCGNGRVLIPLAEAGHDVIGIDHSPDMLELCRRHCDRRGLEATLEVADMSTYSSPERFEAIVIPAGSIYNLQRDEAGRAVSNFWRSLRPGGRFFVDVAAPGFLSQRQDPKTWFRGDLAWTLETLALDLDPLSNGATEVLRYAKWRTGELVLTELHRYWIQLWSLEEFQALLETVGFVDIRVDGDYRHGEPTASTGDWTFSATKPAR